MSEDVGMGDGGDTKVDNAPPANPSSDAALARYAQRMRPLRIIYAVVLLVVALIVGTVVIIAYDRGEISHVTLKTVASPPPAIAQQTPSATLTKSWTSTDATALGTPYYRGTVITHNQHTVRGRDATTGAQTWSYTRTDRSVCAAIQSGGMTIAVYKLHGDCDELTTLDSETGTREWTRTLDENGAVFDGPATYFVQGGNVMFVSDTSIYSIDVNGSLPGVDNWTFYHAGCTINGAVLGTAGALISQTCAHENCNGARLCGNGRQLLLRDGLANYNDNSKTNKNNPDQITWNTFGSDLVPTLAGQHVAGRKPTGGLLQLLAATTGKPGAQLPLAGQSGATAPSSVASPSDADLLWLGGRTYALAGTATAFSWQVSTESVPTVLGADAGTAPALADATIAVPTPSGIALLNPADGTPKQTFAVTAPAAGSLIYPFGTGFVVAGRSTTVYR